jgi:hypothetical protein
MSGVPGEQKKKAKRGLRLACQFLVRRTGFEPVTF